MGGAVSTSVSLTQMCCTVGMCAVCKREGKLSDCYISFIYDLAQLFIYLFIWCVSLLLEVLFFKNFKKWQEMKAIIFLPLHLVNFKHFCVTTWFA